MNTHVACPIRSNACPQISTIPRSQPFQCDMTACQVCQCFTSNIGSDASFIVSSFSIATNVSSFACRTQNFLLLRCLHRQNSQQSFLVAKLDTQRIQMVEQFFFSSSPLLMLANSLNHLLYSRTMLIYFSLANLAYCFPFS